MPFSPNTIPSRPLLLALLSFVAVTCSLLAAVPEGYLDVTAAPYSADNTGATDVTATLQAAINDARDNNLVLWLPGGTYLVSDRLVVDQPDNESAFPVVIMGSTVNPANRAMIVLAANAPGFNDPNARRAVLHYFNSGTVEAETGNTDLYNQAVIGVDFKIRTGNAGAVALRMQGAEGCTIQDVNIDLTEGGHTGIWGIPGSGGSTHRVSVTGGVLGIDTRIVSTLAGGGTQPTVVITGSTFTNQSGQALYATSRGAYVVVGCRILRDTPGAALRLRKSWVGQPFDSSFHFVDSTVEYSTYNVANTVVDMAASNLERSFHFENSYVRNAHQVFNSSAPANPSGWRHYHRLAVHLLPTSRNEAIAWQPKEPIYLDGVASGDVLVDHTDEAPPSDLQSRHQWHADFPTWEHPGVVNVKTLGAVGDGITDDWAVLQAAITNNEKVFFPAGTYQVSKTLDLRPDSKLIGSYHAFTRIRAISTLTNRFAGTTEALGDQPIIRTADTAAADTILAFIGIRRLYPLAQHNPTPVGNYAIEWRCGGTSLARHVEVQSRAGTNMRPDLIAQNFYKYDLATNPINVNHPQQDFQPGHWAWPVSEPTVQIRGNGGGRWFNFWMHGRQGLRNYVPFVRVEGTTQPLNFYHLHIQQQDSINHAEFINSSNVSIYGGKGEIKGTFAYFEGCNNVRFIGHGGLSSPDPAVNPPYLFRFINSDNFLIAGLGTDINEGADKWVGGIYDRWVQAHVRNWKPILDQHTGRAEVQVPWDTRPIIYVRGNPSPEAVTGGGGTTITIDAPVDGASHTYGTPLWLFGTASTSVNGNISHLGIWTSSVNGTLGTGASVSAASLALGLHTITYTVTSPGGTVLSKSISVSVEPAPEISQTIVADNEPVADSYVRGETTSNKSKNYGASSAIETRSAGPGPGYLRFSLGGLPATITSAELFLTTSAADTGTLNILQVASTSWTETGITWNNRPSLGSSLGTISFNGTSRIEHKLDVTAYINSKIASGQANFGTSTTASLLRFYSRQSNYPPRLEITYTQSLPVNAAPVVDITAPASPLAVSIGQSVSFSGTATDAENGNLIASAKWYSSRDGLLGTGASLSLSNLSLGTHSITLHVTDNDGKAGTDTVTVTVNPLPPVITAHPQPATVSVGGSTSLSVTVTGSALSYQWYIGASGVTTAPISGATSASYTTPALSAPTTYWVRVSNDGGALNSTAATVTVNDPPVVTLTAPVSGGIVALGSSVTFSASATDTESGNLASAITWTSSLDGALGTGASLQRNNLSTGPHVITASVTDSGGRTTSASVTLEVRPGAIFSQPFESGSTVASFTGSTADLFDYIGTDTSANNRATCSIDQRAFRVDIAHTDDGNTTQVSTARLTRRTDLPVENDFAVIYSTVELAPAAWPASGDYSWFNMVIGQNFRTGAYSPSGGTGNGPAFTTVSLQARGGSPHTFRTSRTGSATVNDANFTITPVGGIYVARLVLAVNSGSAARAFGSPTGPQTLQPDSMSLWINGVLLVNNAANGLNAAALITDVSLGFGTGTGSTFAVASNWNGTYWLDDVRVSTLSGFDAPANTPPTVAITAPASATTVTQGSNVTFTGTATDTEDGNLAASGTWTSSLDGALGTGGSISTSALSVGNHTITFAVTDSGSLTDSAGIALNVTAAASTTNFNATGTSNITTATAWSNGHPIAGTKIGTIAIDGNFSGNVLSWEVNQTSGNLTSSSNRQLGATDAASPGTIWNLSGGAISFSGTAQINRGTAGIDGIAYTLNVTGTGNLTAFLVQNTSGSFVNVSGGSVSAGTWLSGGSLTLTGGTVSVGTLTMTSTGSTVTFGSGNSSLTVTTALTQDGDTRINFLPGSGGSLTVTGFTQTDYETMWGNGRLRFDNTNTGTFADHFQVIGTKLSLKASDPFAAWLASSSLTGDDSLPEAAPFGDGVANLLKYALGGNANENGRHLLPVPHVSGVSPQPSYLTFTFRRIADPALTYEVWASNDLVNWGATPIWSSTGGQNTSGEITITDPAPMSESPRRFLRLRIVR